MFHWPKKQRRACTKEDVHFFLLLCLGRDPKDEMELTAKVGAPSFGVCRSYLASGIFRRTLLDPLILNRSPAWIAFSETQQKILQKGLKSHFSLKAKPTDLTDWCTCLLLVMNSPRFLKAFEAADHPYSFSWLIRRLQKAQDSGHKRIQGDIETLSPSELSGYALDLNHPERVLLLEVFINNDFIGSTYTGNQRRDIQEQHGGNGLSGFTFKIALPPHLAKLDKMVVHVFEQDSGQPICAGKEVANIGARHEHYLSKLLHELQELRTSTIIDHPRLTSCLDRIEEKLPNIQQYAALPLADYTDHARLFRTRPAPKTRRKLPTAAVFDPGESHTKLKAAKADLLIFSSAGDRLSDLAIGWLCLAAAEQPKADIFFADHDTIRLNGDRTTPVFKAKFDYDLLLGRPDYACAYAIRREAFEAAGGLDNAAASAAHTDLWLKVYEEKKETGFHHVAQTLWRRQEGTPFATTEDHRQALIAHFERQAIPATVHDHEDRFGGKAEGLLSVDWPLDETMPGLAIIIPTRDGLDLTRACVESLRKTLAHPEHTEIIIMDNGSTDPAMLKWFLAEEQAGHIRIIRHDASFNWAEINNKAVAECDAPYLLFLNNDTAATDKGWDIVLRRQLNRPDIGSVGARLLFEDGTIQFGGYILHPERLAVKEAYGDSPIGGGYMNRSQLPHKCSALIGAFLACRRESFEAAGGFDAEHFAVGFNDVDFTITLAGKGLYNLYCPEITFYHFESKSRGYDHQDEVKFRREREERDHLKRKHKTALAHDPYYPKAFLPYEPAYTLLAPPLADE